MGRTSNARERLIVAATELMHERGYAAVRVSAICNRAEVKRGSFFHFFPSKKDLTLAVLDAHWSDIEERVFKPIFRGDEQAMERIRRLLESIVRYQEETRVRFGRTSGCPVAVLGSELDTEAPEIGEKVRSILAQLRAYLERALSEASRHDEYANLDVSGSARTLLAYIEGALLMARIDNETTILRDIFSANLPLVYAN